MNKYEIVKEIEKFAPIDTAEKWDCVGFMVETKQQDVSKIMLCLTPTADIVKQARQAGCDMIISHHPLFYVPLEWNDIDIYSAHTNLDKAACGTTDTLIQALNFTKNDCRHEFLRLVEFQKGIGIFDFAQNLRKISPNLRYVNNLGIKTIKCAAFCAGSGTDFIQEAKSMGADCLVTGDLKFHTALDSEIVVFDIGHFESEILVLPVLREIIGTGIEVVFSDEQSPFMVLG